MTATPAPSVLVSGAGSIGKRHLRNLHAQGIGALAICDPDPARLTEAANQTPCKTYTDFHQALASEKPDAVFVCSPTRWHLSQAVDAAGAAAHLFIEKPLSHTMDGVERLAHAVEEQRLCCMVGCNMRFHFGPKTVKTLLTEGKIGTVTHATVYTGSFLPDWRPVQDYRKSYSADPLQGGALLDCIHEIDLALWYMGPATLVSAALRSADVIGIPVEGTADLILEHGKGVTSSVHLSFTEKEYRRFCRIEGAEGTIAWDIGEKTVTLRGRDGKLHEIFREPAGEDLNRMYEDELRHFLDCMRRNVQPQGNLREAIAALKIALEAKRGEMRKESPNT
ncbi:MAG: Gfo/Idh/MocA family oxidoreductase [Candidatus Peregrinibacteria bacterium]